MTDSITLNSVSGQRVLGPGRPCYVVAEMSANHGQDIEKAEAIIRAAKDAGADAVKLQTYTPDTMTIDSDAACFRVRGTIWEGRKLHALYGEAFTPWEWQPRLMRMANDLGMDLFSTPFDPTAVKFLEDMGAPCHKVASFEVVDIPLLECIAQTGKPVILSTGMASLGEIEEAVRVLRRGGCPVALLKCTSAYPAPPAEANLATIPHLAQTFRCPAGLSDHTMGSAVAVAAVSLGASILEKHFTLSRDEAGPDSSFSMEPGEFKDMVRDIRMAEQAVGVVCYDLTEAQRGSLAFRRSLFVVRPVARGETFTSENVRSIRPSDGLHPRHLRDVLGRRASRDIPQGVPLDWELVAP